MVKYSILSLATLLLSFTSFAQPSPYEPDSAYGQYGISTPHTPVADVNIHQILGSALQADDKLVLVSNGNFNNKLALMRLDTTGALDTSFNHTGIIDVIANGINPWYFNTVRIVPSGNIMVGFSSSNPGNMRLSVMCFKPNGTLNTSFGIGGKADVGTSVAGTILSMGAMDVQPDGKTVLAGGGPGGSLPYKYKLARLKTNGTLDTSFGTNGIVHCPYFVSEARNVQLFAIRVQTDGKILCIGEMPSPTGGADTMALIRYKANGTLDTSFGINGLAKYADRFKPGEIRINAAGEIYTVGKIGHGFSPDTLLIKKFSPTGSIVSSFGTAGTATVNATFATYYSDTGHMFEHRGRFELLSDGKIIVGGSSNTSDTGDFRVCRLMPDGSFDTVFAPNGTITMSRLKPDYCTNVLVQSNDRILLTGYARKTMNTFDSCSVLTMRFRDTAKTPIPPPTNITGRSLQYQGHVYPNPSNDGHFTLHYTNAATTTPVNYTISNIAGQAISTGSFNMLPGNATRGFIIDKQLPDGMYILQLISSGQVATYKLLHTH